MKRDSQEGASLQPVIDHCCWSTVKLQLNSFSIIITICFPYSLEMLGWDQPLNPPHRPDFFIWSWMLSVSMPSHHDFPSELIPAIGHIWHLVRSKPKPLPSGATYLLLSFLPVTPHPLFSSFTSSHHQPIMCFPTSFHGVSSSRGSV